MSSAKRLRAASWIGAVVLLASFAWLLRDSTTDLADGVARPQAHASGPTDSLGAIVDELDARAKLDSVARSAPGAPLREVSAQREEAPVLEERFEFEVELRVLDTWDLPVAGATILAGPSGQGLSTIGATDRDGRLAFAFRAFAPRVELDLALRGDLGRIERVSLNSGRFELTRRIHTSMAVQAAIIEGRLGGTAVSKFTIAVHERGPTRDVDTSRARVASAAGGRIVFAWGAHSDGERQVSWRRLPDRPAETLSLVKSARIETAPPSLDSLRVRVRDASGAPVEGASVAALAVSGRRTQLASTDGAGACAFDKLASVEQRFVAWRVGHGRAQASRTPDAFGEPVELVLSRADLRRALLVDSRGLALADWRVWVEERSSTSSHEVLGVTDERGEFEFVAPLTAPVRVCAAPSRSGALPIEILREHMLTGSEFTFVAPFDGQLEPAQARVRARARQGPARAPIEVWLRDVDSGFAIELDSAQSDSADDSAVHVHATGLEAGRYEFELRCAGSAPVRSAPFALRAGEDFDAGLLEFAPPSRLWIEPRASTRPGVTQGRLLVRWGDFEFASQPLKLAQGAELWLEPGDYRLVSEDLLEPLGAATLPSAASIRLRPDGVAERLGP